MKTVQVKFKLIENGILPTYKTSGAVCMDCSARLDDEKIIIPIGKRKAINLGFAVEIPQGYEMVIRPRSGLSKNGIDTAIGTIDCDYRGEVKACLINNSDKDFIVNNYDRICQIALREAPIVEPIISDNLSDTERQENGFGSTGV